MRERLEEFYVGYQPKAPRSLAKTVKRIVAGVVLTGLAVGILLVLDQRFAASKFEFGVYREYTGTIEDWPAPTLVTPNSSYVLVAPGKHGLSGLERYRQKSVRLKGSLIERGTDRLLEVVPDSMQEIASAPSTEASPVIDLGAMTLRGEIVDSKCYFGVMNPGEHKVHRDCAVRCISGGIPPAFIVRDASGVVRTLLLAGENGGTLNREVLPFVAEPVEISGELVKSGSTLVLKANPAHFRRLQGV
jgi:hypothetical protein